MPFRGLWPPTRVSICSLDDVLGFHNLSQVSILIHFADATSHATVIRQGILQYKTSHARLTAIYQILVDGLEAFFTIVVICIDDNERSINHIFRRKDGLASPPRLCPACRKFSRNIVDILKCVVHSYIVGLANGGNAITDDLFELLLDILADDAALFIFFVSDVYIIGFTPLGIKCVSLP